LDPIELIKQTTNAMELIKRQNKPKLFEVYDVKSGCERVEEELVNIFKLLGGVHVHHHPDILKAYLKS
jgi:hypothetical protein